MLIGVGVSPQAVTSASGGGGGSVGPQWILATGFWVDASPWDDTQLWKDS